MSHLVNRGDAGRSFRLHFLPFCKLGQSFHGVVTSLNHFVQFIFKVTREQEVEVLLDSMWQSEQMEYTITTNPPVVKLFGRVGNGVDAG